MTRFPFSWGTLSATTFSAVGFVRKHNDTVNHQVGAGERTAGKRKLAIEEVFGVKVESVNVVNCKGKLKRMGRNEGYTPDYKKAIVQLTADSKTIEFFDSLS